MKTTLNGKKEQGIGLLGLLLGAGVGALVLGIGLGALVYHVIIPVAKDAWSAWVWTDHNPAPPPAAQDFEDSPLAMPVWADDGFELASGPEMFRVEYIGTVYSSTIASVTNGSSAWIRINVVPPDPEILFDQPEIWWGLLVDGDGNGFGRSFKFFDGFAWTETGFRLHFGHECRGGGFQNLVAAGAFTESSGTISVGDTILGWNGSFDVMLMAVPEETNVVQIVQGAGGVWVNAPAGVLETTTTDTLGQWVAVQTNEVARVLPAEAGTLYRVKIND